MAGEKVDGQSTASCGQIKPTSSEVSEHKCDFNAQEVLTTGSFTAGRLAHFVAKWRELTSDKWIIDTVQHYHIEFISSRTK